MLTPGRREPPHKTYAVSDSKTHIHFVFDKQRVFPNVCGVCKPQRIACRTCFLHFRCSYFNFFCDLRAHHIAAVQLK